MMIPFFLAVLVPSLGESAEVKNDTPEVYQIRLRWQSVPGASSYVVQISSERKFENIVEEFEIDEPLLTWKYDPEAFEDSKRVFYRVASIDSEGEMGLFSEPQPLSLPKKVPPKEFVPIVPKDSVIQTTEEKSDLVLQWTGALELGWGGFNQSSDEFDLKRVSSNAPTFQQKALLHLKFIKGAPKWSVQVHFQFSPYRRIQEPRTFEQPDVSSYQLTLRAHRWSSIFRSWSLGYGLALSRSYRWIKLSSEAVQPQGAFSLGPGFVLEKVSQSDLIQFWPVEGGVSVICPMTGVLTGGHIGADVSTWAIWNVTRTKSYRFGIRAEGDLSYLRWQSPNNTSSLNWAGWLAIAVQTLP